MKLLFQDIYHQINYRVIFFTGVYILPGSLC